jgi:hypothetical protein
VDGCDDSSNYCQRFLNQPTLAKQGRKHTYGMGKVWASCSGLTATASMPFVVVLLDG